MDFTAGFPSLSGMFRKLLGGTPAVEILPPEAEPDLNHEKQEITDLMNRIGNYLKDIQGDHHYIDNVTMMQNGYIGVIMSNPEKTASQIIAYTIDEDKNGNPIVNKENTRIVKAGEDDFPEQKEEKNLKPLQNRGDDYVETLSQIIIEDVSETLGVDEVAITATVQGDVILEGRIKQEAAALAAG